MPLFESESPETIKGRILGRMETELQTREGSYTNDMVSPTAFELWRVLMTLGELVSAFYVDENSGPYLDDHARLVGLERKEGTRAQAEIRFTGRDGTVVPAGTVFLTPEGLRYTLDRAVVLDGGQGTGTVTAADVGDVYNAEEGELSRILRNISGLDSWISAEAAGGTDPETDAALFERIDQRRKDPGTSGNEAHYKEWALECEGVGACKVTGLWDGPGTVRVLIVGYDREPVDEDVVSDCAAYIQTKRPVGADVTVVSATGTEIDVSAALTLAAGTEFPTVKASFVSKLDTYLRELAFEEYTVVYARIAALLMSVEGVEDYTALTVNGGTVNITIAETAVPVPGEVTLT